jgi:phospholipase/carboxylesterase
MALITGLEYALPLAGAVALSGYLPLADTCRLEHELPIFLGHGLADSIVPMELFQYTQQMIEKWVRRCLHTRIQWHTKCQLKKYRIFVNG